MRLYRVLSTAVVLLIAGALVQPAAQEGGGPGHGGERFSLGLIVGYPTGISAKYWLAEHSAVDAALAWNFQSERFHIHADYLHHFFEAFDVAPDRLPLYLGIGGNFRVRGDAPGDSVRSGIRVPLGVSFLSSELPLEAFGEVVPGLRIVPGTEFELWGGIGVRYRF